MACDYIYDNIILSSRNAIVENLLSQHRECVLFSYLNTRTNITIILLYHYSYVSRELFFLSWEPMHLMEK